MTRPLKRFERYQVILTAIQTVALVAATAGAIWIGVIQTRINRKLYELDLSVAAEVTYDQSTKRLNIFNRGRENIWLWGDKLGSGPKTVEKEGRLIVPGGSYYIFADTFEREVLEKVGHDGETQVPFQLLGKDAADRPFVVDLVLFVQVRDGAVTVHTQTTSIRHSAW
jgi:hypothetical protein